MWKYDRCLLCVHSGKNQYIFVIIIGIHEIFMSCFERILHLPLTTCMHYTMDRSRTGSVFFVSPEKNYDTFKRKRNSLN